MYEFTKDDKVKIMDEEGANACYDLLRAEGWECEAFKAHEKPKDKTDEVELLRAELDEKGVKYHHMAGVKKLKALLAGE